MFILLKILNIKVNELLPYIDFSKSLSYSERLRDKFTSISPLIFWDIKNEMIQYYLEEHILTFLFNYKKINIFININKKNKCVPKDLKINLFKV